MTILIVYDNLSTNNETLFEIAPSKQGEKKMNTQESREHDLQAIKAVLRCYPGIETKFRQIVMWLIDQSQELNHSVKLYTSFSIRDCRKSAETINTVFNQISPSACIVVNRESSFRRPSENDTINISIFCGDGEVTPFFTFLLKNHWREIYKTDVSYPPKAITEEQMDTLKRKVMASNDLGYKTIVVMLWLLDQSEMLTQTVRLDILTSSNQKENPRSILASQIGHGVHKGNSLGLQIRLDLNFMMLGSKFRFISHGVCEDGKNGYIIWLSDELYKRDTDKIFRFHPDIIEKSKQKSK